MQFLNAVDPELRLKLGVEVESDLTHGLFASQLSSKVDTQIQQLQALSEHTVNDSSIASLEEEESTVETLDEHSRGLGQFEAGIEYLREQLAAKQKADEANADKVKEELADIFSFAFLLAEKYGFDVKEIVLDKIKINGEKYPVEKAKGSSEKYNEL